MKKLVNGSKIGVVLVGVALISFACLSRSEAASFQGLGDLPGGADYSYAWGVTPDGSVVVGQSISASGPEAFRWTAGGGMVGLGDLPGGNFASVAYGVSADGSVAVGFSYSASGWESFRWTAGGGMVGLGDLPGGNFYSRAWDVSADGSVVVGSSRSASGSEAFRWTDVNGNGLVDPDEKLDSHPEFGLGDLPGGDFSSYAYGVSADGFIVVGGGESVSGSEAFRWKDLNGNGEVEADEKLDHHPEFGLGDLSGGSFDSRAYGGSADSSVVVGYGSSASGQEAFRWTVSGGMVGLGDLPGGDFSSWAFDVSGDGSVVVGYGESASGREAFIWDADHGMRNLRNVLVDDCGLDLSGWTLSRTTGVSADGLTFVGYGFNPDGNEEAWMATIPEPVTLVLVAIGALGLLFATQEKNPFAKRVE